MTQHLIIYHGGKCADGFTAAWVCYREIANAMYHPARYGEAPPDVADKSVIIVDFSYARETLIEMHQKARALVVLDHHKTALEALHNLSFCIFDMDRSGARMAWDYFNARHEPPALVRYVEDRDLWRFALPHSKEINAFIGSYEQSFANWDDIDYTLKHDFGGAVEQGAAILRSVGRYVWEVSQQARWCEVHGHRVPVVNAAYPSISELLHGLLLQPSLCGEPAFAVGWHQRADGQYNYSLRSVGDFDVSAIAKLHGGGGHKNAAGFNAPTQLW